MAGREDFAHFGESGIYVAGETGWTAGLDSERRIRIPGEAIYGAATDGRCGRAIGAVGGGWPGLTPPAETGGGTTVTRGSQT